MKKRILSILLILVMVLGTFSTVFAANGDIRFRNTKAKFTDAVEAALSIETVGAEVILNSEKYIYEYKGKYYEIEDLFSAFNKNNSIFLNILETEYIPIPDYDSSYLIEWGLGETQTKHVNLDKPYEWYMPQNNTGIYWYENCGPTAATMAIKWSVKQFNKTPEDARKKYQPNGGWWYTSDVKNYLDLNQVSNFYLPLNSMSSLTNQLDKGNIAILCLDMSYIRTNLYNPEQHVDLHYKPGTGHFIVVKGYRLVDGELFFEIYDPAAGNLKYNDGSIKSIDRYYRAEDIDISSEIWWDYAIIVGHDMSKYSLSTMMPIDVPIQRSGPINIQKENETNNFE